MKNWQRTTEERYNYMLELLPPAVQLGHGFLVGEPWRHNADGAPEFMAFCRCNGQHYECEQPLSVAEFRALDPHAIAAAVS